MGQIIVIQRHGNAAKAATDIERMLSDKGRTQATVMQRLLMERRLNGADVVLSSVAQRAIDTVALDGAVVTIHELYMPGGEDGVEMDRLFGLIGYGTYRAYLEADATGALRRWAGTALAAVTPRIEGARFVRIGCHAILSNALAMALLPEDAKDGRDAVLDAALGEASCIVIRQESSIEIITCP